MYLYGVKMGLSVLVYLTRFLNREIFLSDYLII